MKASVVIVSAGRGTRAGSDSSDIPKQYRVLGNRTVLARVLSTFVAHESVADIQPVIHPDDQALFVASAQGYGDKVLQPVYGGATRQASVLAGLEALAPRNPDYVLIHDAARPFVGHDVVDRVLDALQRYDAAIPALPVSDTVKKSDGTLVTGTLDRTGLWAVQTPQGFRLDVILEAHQAARTEGKQDFTDDASIAEWHGSPVRLVEGDTRNVKLTTTDDFEMAEKALQSGETRTGQGFDVHAFGPGDHVMLCGIEIPHDYGLKAHSDGDVGLHALTDALLGAIGDGDIGSHFPPSDLQWKNASSDQFLMAAANKVASAGGAIVNVDITLICEDPKIGPHRDAMRERLAGILGIEISRVSVKATTTEGLGLTGRGEGIAAMATATVRLS